METYESNSNQTREGKLSEKNIKTRFEAFILFHKRQELLLLDGIL